MPLRSYSAFPTLFGGFQRWTLVLNFLKLVICLVIAFFSIDINQTVAQTKAPLKLIYLGGLSPEATERTAVALGNLLRSRHSLLLGQDFVIEGRTWRNLETGSFVVPKNQTPAERERTELQMKDAQKKAQIISAYKAAADADLIYAGSWDVANALKAATLERKTPVVFAVRANLESERYQLVQQPGAPEANLTGFTRYAHSVGKKIQLLVRSKPGLKHVALVHGDFVSPQRRAEYQAACSTLGVKYSELLLVADSMKASSSKIPISNLASTLNRLDIDGFVLAEDGFLQENRAKLVEQLRLVGKPVVYPEPAPAGISALQYYPKLTRDDEALAEAARYLAYLLKGGKVKDLAVSLEPKDFELAVDLSVAKRGGWQFSKDALNTATRILGEN
jgi:hypothetical protein